MAVLEEGETPVSAERLRFPDKPIEVTTMQQPRFSIRGLLAAVTVAAGFLAMARSIRDPIFWVTVLVAGSIVGLALIRAAGELARRRAEGASAGAGDVASILLSSTAVAAIIVGFSDVAFLVGYNLVEYTGPSHSHFGLSGFCAPGAVAGLVSALVVATSLKQVIWARGPRPTAEARQWVRLWPVAVIALFGLGLVGAAQRERCQYCRTMANVYAGLEARAGGPGHADRYAWFRHYYEQAAYRPWLAIHPAPTVYGTRVSRPSRKGLNHPVSAH